MMEDIYVLSMLVMLLTANLAQCFEYEVSSEERLTFGKMTTFMHTSGHVHHMAADEYIPGNILFSDSRSMKTADGNTITTIAGSPSSYGYQNGVGVQAKFHVVKGFFQVTPNEVIIVDYVNHCIRWLDRRNVSVSDLAGKCEKVGYADGMGTNARFKYPTSGIRDTRNTNHVIISDSQNDALRVLDVKTASVSTLLKSDSLNLPWAFTIDPTDKDALIITHHYGIQKLFLSVTCSEDISGGSRRAFKDGSLKDARYNLCQGILPLHNQIYIISDYLNHRLRVVDLLNDKVSSICTGTIDHLDGPVSECQLNRPASLLLIGNNLYIGTWTRIRTLPVSLEKTGVTTTTTTTTTHRMPTTSTINSPQNCAILRTTKTSTSIKPTAFQPTKLSDVGGDQMPREKTSLESTAGLPAAEPGKDNTLAISLGVPLSVLSICAVVVLIAFAIRERRRNTSRTQSTSNVCTADPSQSNNNSSGTSQGQHSNNEMFSLQERPPPYEYNHIPHPPQIEGIYQNCDVESQSTPSAPTLSSLRHAP